MGRQVRKLRVAKNLSTFSYKPLSSNTYRTFSLHPGKFESPLEITLQNRDLEAPNEAYETLSYVWGTPTRNVSLKCNGAVLKITPNLDIALRYSRNEESCRLLWVDAICINQDDLDERAHQVTLMKEIFLRAEKVLVWLGEEDKDTCLALECLKYHASFKSRSSMYKGPVDFDFVDYSEQRMAVGSLLQRAWFNRCWTFQEIRLSTRADLLVGDYRLPWETFQNAISNIPRAVWYSSSMRRRIDIILDSDLRISRDLSSFLELMRDFDTSDPRDKLFSAISLATIKNANNFYPNYKKSVRETFISFALEMIRSENSLNILMSRNEETRDKSLPSWCPDWRSKRNTTWTGYCGDIKWYDVNDGLCPNLSNVQMNEKNELELDGAMIDVVKEVYYLEELDDELCASVDAVSFTPVLSKFAHNFGLHECLLHNHLTPEAVLLRTLSANQWFFNPLTDESKLKYFYFHHQYGRDNFDLSDCYPPRGDSMVRDVDHEGLFTQSVINVVYRQASPFYDKGQNAFLRNDMFQNILRKDSDCIITNNLVRNCRVIASEAIRKVRSIYDKKCILISEKGFIALGSSETKVGDNLCSFWGANVPFVIRKKRYYIPKPDLKCDYIEKISSSDEVFEIVDECYIDGIMNGEIFSKMNESNSPILKEQRLSHEFQDRIRIGKFRVA